MAELPQTAKSCRSGLAFWLSRKRPFEPATNDHPLRLPQSGGRLHAVRMAPRSLSLISAVAGGALLVVRGRPLLILAGVLTLGPFAQRAVAQDAVLNLFRSHSNDVAVRIVELPEKYRRLYSASLAFSPDGRLLADQAETTPQYEVVNVWDWRDKRIVKTLPEPLGAARSKRWNSLLFVNGFLAMCVGSGGTEHTAVRVWNTKDWSVADDMNENAGVCVAIGVLGDEKALVYAMSRLGVMRPGVSTDSELVARAVGSWEELWRLPLSIHPEAMAISPDGSLAAVTGGRLVVTETLSDPRQTRLVRSEGRLVLVDLKQHRVVREIPTQVGGCVTWSADGARITMAGEAELEIVDVGSGAKMGQPAGGPRIAPRGILSDPAGRYLIEYDWNGRGEGFGVKIWDAGREHLLQHLRVGDAGAAAISGDGKYLAVGETGQTTVWQLK